MRKLICAVMAVSMIFLSGILRKKRKCTSNGGRQTLRKRFVYERRGNRIFRVRADTIL